MSDRDEVLLLAAGGLAAAALVLIILGVSVAVGEFAAHSVPQRYSKGAGLAGMGVALGGCATIVATAYMVARRHPRI